MENRIKDSYYKVRMPEDSKEQIRKNILDSAASEKGVMTGNRGEGSSDRKKFMFGWKAGLAACLGLALVIPTGVYAAQKLSKYFSVNINKEKYLAEINLEKPEAVETAAVQEEVLSKENMKYIRVETDFGKDYTENNDQVYYVQDEDGKVTAHQEKIEEGKDGMYSFSHKDGYGAGKNFYYDVIYMDQEGDSVLKLYDQAHMKEIMVNGHKAFLCQSAGVQGSQYNPEKDTDYTINVYVFYEEYGYIINYCGMQGLGEESLIALAEKTKVAECSKSKASRYQYLSLYHTGNTDTLDEDNAKEEVAGQVKRMGEKLEDKDSGFTYQVTNVAVSSKIKDMDRTKMDDSLSPTGVELWDKKGNLQSYTRESITKGDGVSKPEQTVSGSEKVQLKMVYVTMKVKANKDNELFELPNIKFLEKEGEKYYDTDLYYRYNRPEKIANTLMDFAPCYFRETEGGKGFRIKKMRKGEEQTYHFAYLVDEDMIDKMFLVIDFDYTQETQYVELKSDMKD